MRTTEPFKLAIGNTSQQLNSNLTGGIDHAKVFPKPVHVISGRAASCEVGFCGIGDLLLSANVHADDVRVQHTADCAIGIVHGPLYIPADPSRERLSLLFDTVLMVFNDEHGIVYWMLPAEACPPGSDFLYGEMRRLIGSLQRARKRPIDAKIAKLAQESLAITMHELRPWPISFGKGQWRH